MEGYIIMMEKLSLDKFEEAYERVQEVVLPTNLVQSDFFSQMTGNKVYFKPENLQLTGAYKIRGAYYKISTLSDEEKAKGLITASAGNHAQGVAYAARKFGAPAIVVMPTTTPLLKVNVQRNLGQKSFSMEMFMTKHVRKQKNWQQSMAILLYIRLMI